MKVVPSLLQLSVAAALAALGACSPNATIIANRDQSYTKDIKRLVVIESIGDELGRFHDSFKTALTQRLKDCGAAVDFTARAKRDPLALDNSAAQAQQRKEAALIKEFSPDAILLMTQTSVTWSGGNARNIDYAMQLFDAATKRAFWKANVHLFTNFDLVDIGDPGDVLAKDLMARFVQDRVIQSCPTVATR